MKRKILIGILLAPLLVACGYPADKEKHGIALKEISCMRANAGLDQYQLVEKCAHLLPSRNFSGTYFLGFERSAFVENYSANPASLSQHGKYFELVVPKSIGNTTFFTREGYHSAFYVEFVGRESDIPGAAGKPMIILDKILKVKRVTEKR